MRRLMVVVPLAAVAASLAAAPAVAKRTSTVHVTMKDYSFVISPKTVTHGQIAFKLDNTGKADHDFSIGGHTSKIIGPGKKGELLVTLAAGKHPYKCTVDAHAKLGMKGVLVVK